VTFTISERWRFFQRGLVSLLVIPFLCAVACDQPTQPSQPSVRNRVPTVAQTDAPPAAPLSTDVLKKEEPPYYGSTYWEELLTSVYYYPAQGGDNGDLTVPSTHLKFNHRDDALWLCGDQRKIFEPGRTYRLLVTFEPNQPCVTNWKIE